ncbi:hypothetical protein AVEN_263135-1 [Araneus ventricosus]|uniref:Uncharacterized protein n=1 Tax=Araneus ventricosus TaxID=182803 RepID=A0A4Y2F8X2_ARAVE|nr:hypothetical protein AVEN_263135-1 [Araneus ventricosus]
MGLQVELRSFGWWRFCCLWHLDKRIMSSRDLAQTNRLLVFGVDKCRPAPLCWLGLLCGGASPWTGQLRPGRGIGLLNINAINSRKQANQNILRGVGTLSPLTLTLLLRCVFSQNLL